jgi:hypothetical protein
MAAGKYDIRADQGSEYKLKLVLKNKDGSRKDLTDFTGKAQIRRRATASTVDGEFSVSFIVPRDQGEIELVLPASISSAMKVGDTQDDKNSLYVYDLELYEPVTLKPIRVIDGTLKLSPEVTR